MDHVKVILRQDVASLGEAGEVVSVKPGYAFNFLLPGGKAILASEGKLKELEHHRRVVAEQVARERKTLEAERDRLSQVVLEIAAQVGEEGKLFGSVTAIQIAELLAQRGHVVDRRKIALEDPIKEAGEHEVPIRLHREIVAKLKVKVVAAE
ncbi:50S ribosomal protein L9 [Myxococcaceae bacterium]|jgi:large subunit ribosomal protein L9|nr:50S ribosomal protein L9 [Myxococcaceae bacterium]